MHTIYQVIAFRLLVCVGFVTLFSAGIEVGQVFVTVRDQKHSFKEYSCIKWLVDDPSSRIGGLIVYSCRVSIN